MTSAPEIENTPKTIEQNFADWEEHVFGFGYGTGERFILAALKSFFETIGQGEAADRAHCYDYRHLEEAVMPAVAWLLICTLCHADIIEYGSSPRFGWLTAKGKALKAFLASKPLDDLVRLCTGRTEDDIPCGPDFCNCGPNGYDPARRCPNPFWSAP